MHVLKLNLKEKIEIGKVEFKMDSFKHLNKAKENWEKKKLENQEINLNIGSWVTAPLVLVLSESTLFTNINCWTYVPFGGHSLQHYSGRPH